MDTKIKSDAVHSFDVFISYASADKEPVQLLVHKLNMDGFRVWFAEEQIITGPPTLGQLVDGIANSSHIIVCLSDAYIEREFTIFELQTNLSLDPTNRLNRTIPVKIRPLSKSVPMIIQAFRYGDLTDSSQYDTEYKRITESIHRDRPSQIIPTQFDRETLERNCKAPFEDPEKPNVALFLARLAVEAICKFLYRQEVGELSSNLTFDPLIERILSTKKIPEHVKISLSVAQKFGNIVVKDRMEDIVISKESIQPGLAALRVLSDWTFSTYFGQAEKKDIWDSIWEQLPVQKDHKERAIPGTNYVLRGPRLSLNSLGPLYAGRNTEFNQAIAANIVAFAEDYDALFFEEVAQFIRLNEASIVRPLYSGKIIVNDKRLCLYVILEHVNGASGQDLVKRFGNLPPLAAYELCRGVAISLEGLHTATPQIVHGDIKPANIIVDQYGGVKVLCVGRNPAVTAEDASLGAAAGKIDSFLFSSPEQLSGVKDLTPKTDLFALRAMLFYLLTGEYEASIVSGERGVDLPIAALETLEKLSVCSTAKEAFDIMDNAYQRLVSTGVNLRTVIDSYIKKKNLPTRSPDSISEIDVERISISPQPPKPKPTDFFLLTEFSIEGRGAWPLGEDCVLVWEAGADTLSILKGPELLWRDSQPLHLRKISAGPDHQLAVTSWEGHIRCFIGDAHTTSVKLDGAIGDLQYCSDRWIVGTWKHSLVAITMKGTIIPIFNVDKGVFRIAVTDSGDRFAVADLSGGISFYTGGHKVIETTPFDKVSSMAFVGKRLMLIAGEWLIAIDLSGKEIAREKVGNARLFSAPKSAHCLLLDEKGNLWELDEVGRRLPYFNFLAGQKVLSMCTIPKRFTLTLSQGGCTYWRNGEHKQSWTEAISANLSQDGRFVAVTFSGKVLLYEDPK